MDRMIDELILSYNQRGRLSNDQYVKSNKNQKVREEIYASEDFQKFKEEIAEERQVFANAIEDLVIGDTVLDLLTCNEHNLKLTNVKNQTIMLDEPIKHFNVDEVQKATDQLLGFDYHMVASERTKNITYLAPSAYLSRGFTIGAVMDEDGNYADFYLLEDKLKSLDIPVEKIIKEQDGKKVLILHNKGR